MLNLFLILSLLFFISCGKKEKVDISHDVAKISKGNYTANLYSLDKGKKINLGEVSLISEPFSFLLSLKLKKDISSYNLMILDGFTCPNIDRNNDGQLDGMEIITETGPAILDFNTMKWDSKYTVEDKQIFKIRLNSLWQYITDIDNDPADYLTKISVKDSFDFEERPVILLERIDGELPPTMLGMPGSSSNEIPLACGKLSIPGFSPEFEEVKDPPRTRRVRRNSNPQGEIEVNNTDDDISPPSTRWSRVRQRVRRWWRRVWNNPEVPDKSYCTSISC